MLRPRNLAGIALAVLSGFSFGTLPVFITWLSQRGIGAWVQVAARLSVSALILGAALALAAPASLRIGNRRRVGLLLTNGALMLTAFTAYVLSISLGTPAAKAVLLVYLYPIFVALAGPRLLGERLTRRRLASTALGVVGAAVIVGFWDVQALGRVQSGDLLALLTGIAYAGVVVLGRIGSTRERLPSPVLTFWSFVAALAWLLVGGLAVVATLGAPDLLLALPAETDPRMVRDLMGLAVFGTAVPYGLLFAALGRTEAGTASILMLVEPVSVFLMSAAFLHQPIRWWHLAGGAVILAAAALASTQPQRASADR
jgi:DME family drug/metabolite transporter